MQETNNKNKSFKLPSYIQIPFFLYQDNRLEKSAMLIAAFFYSIHTAGLRIKASSDYLCALAGIHKRQFYKIMNQIEEFEYIKRTGFTNRKKIEWIYNPNSSITVEELDTSAPQDTGGQELNTSALQDTQLVHSRTLNLCTRVHTDNKEDNKEKNKRSKTLGDLDQSPVAKAQEKVFCEKVKKKEKPPEDYRSNDEFMAFYSNYPNKQKPTAAYKAFLKLNPDSFLVQKIIQDVKQRLQNNWFDRPKSKIPYPATYLASKEWEGEMVVTDNKTLTKEKKDYFNSVFLPAMTSGRV